MAHASVADQRREQIIQATITTIAERGINGTTLDKIAETAGMSRGHIRHFAGNRDQLLVDTARAFYAGDDGKPGILPLDVTDLAEAVNYFFGEEFTASSADDAVVLGLVELSRSAPDIAAVLNDAYSATRAKLIGFIAQAKPLSPTEAREWAAEGLLSAAMGNVFIGEFERDAGHTTRTRRAIEAMLAAL